METKRYLAKVKNCQPEMRGSNVYFLEIELPLKQFWPASPGQFVVIEPKFMRSVMPRPFSIVYLEGKIMSLLINVVGENTKAYSQLKPGDEISLLGPLGRIIDHGFFLEADNYLLVGGGYGGAALVSFADMLSFLSKNYEVLLGSKTRNRLAGLTFFHKLGSRLSTICESDSDKPGLATDLLSERLSNISGKTNVIACGPKPMLKKVAELCAVNKIRCFVILEEIMACGVGSCKGCAVYGEDGSFRHVCTDGPTFDTSEWKINWEKFAPPEKKVLKILPAKKVNLGVNFQYKRKGMARNLFLEYPTMNGSGCLGIEALESKSADYENLGALVTKGVTVMPRSGNKMPRICETPAGMINSIGLENVGLGIFVEKELSRWLAFGKPVFVNISGYKISEYVLLTKAIARTGAAGIEVNISCPNIEEGGMFFGTDPITAFQVINAVRAEAKDKFIIAKLTPNVTDIAAIAKAVWAAGADAISLINTIQAMAIDVRTRRPKIGAISGGLSGPAIRPIGVKRVYDIYQAGLGVYIIGMGGIEDAESAAEYFIAGAHAVAIGTGGFSRWNIFGELNLGLMEVIRHHRLSSVGELTGSLIID